MVLQFAFAASLVHAVGIIIGEIAGLWRSLEVSSIAAVGPAYAFRHTYDLEI